MLVGVLRAMYEDDTITVDVNGTVGGLIKLNRGVKQGSIIKSLNTSLNYGF